MTGGPLTNAFLEKRLGRIIAPASFYGFVTVHGDTHRP